MTSYLPPKAPFVLLENTRDADGLSYFFEKPESVASCTRPEDVDRTLAEIETAVADGLHAAGWISYEVGQWLEPRLRPLLENRGGAGVEPLIWMGLFRSRKTLTRADLDTWWQDACLGRPAALSPLTLGLDRNAYLAALDRVAGYLAAGDIYQVNFTMMAQGAVAGDPLALHRRLSRAQPVSYGAFISTGDWCVSSHSPELFFARRGEAATVQPMKGTAVRGRTTEEDDRAASALAADPKSRAENLMIVDLERNDLSRIAEPGSVRVTEAFHVDRYPTLLTMISTVGATLRPHCGPGDVLRAMFPCGSVTGAPKIRAMEIVRELEAGPRGIYTGAIGHLSPDGDATLNVPIRTLVIGPDGLVRFGVGSGVVADSDSAAEYEECLLKASFLENSAEAPALIETILWQPGAGYWLLDSHMERLKSSARYFRYPCDAAAVRRALEDAAQHFGPLADRRVRLLLSPSGEVSITAATLDLDAERTGWRDALPTAILADTRVRSDDPYLFHKTTRRQVYNHALAQAQASGHWDAIFCNESGELTEGARSNLFLVIDGKLLTPPIGCGLLPGTFRSHVLSRAKVIVAGEELEVAERILLPDDFCSASRIFLGNAIYGFVEVDAKYLQSQIS